jgi:cellulose synthase/poly-beta-1,6-N-acetylglucosamine synthase-like glycosyltransferase
MTQDNGGDLVDDRNVFFVVLARDKRHVNVKIEELERLDVPYRIICGDIIDHPKVVCRRPKGKYDAINHSLSLIPEDASIVIYNDVDTRIINYKPLLERLKNENIGMAYAPELVTEGPQATFFKIFNPLRSRIPLAATGELMAVRRKLLEKILPLKPTKAEDTYMMFKTLELGYKVVQCDECSVSTERTKEPGEEQHYKRRTITGIYQALSLTNPPAGTRLVYTLLPIVSLLLIILGPKGYYTAKGITLGLLDYLRGDRTGAWKQDYL